MFSLLVPVKYIAAIMTHLPFPYFRLGFSGVSGTDASVLQPCSFIPVD